MRLTIPLLLVLLLAAGLTAPTAASASGSIAGHVTDADDNALAGICVVLHAADTLNVIQGPVLTDEHGDYTFAPVAAGSYKVEFNDDSTSCPGGEDFYFAQWYHGQPDSSAAHTVVVVDGSATTGIDAVMAEHQGIAGHVKDVNGTSLANICVIAKLPSSPSTSEPPAGFAQTDADGDYLMEVPAGQYKVSFYDGGIPCNVGKYVAQWYNDKPDFGSADTVVVATARTTVGISAVMQLPSRITGHVQDEAGLPLAGICIVAGDPLTLNPVGPPPGFARTDAGGDYVMDIAPGDYKVSFYDGGFPCNVGKYVQQWFNGKSDFASADVVHVGRGATVAGIGATLKAIASQTTTTAAAPPVAPAVTKCRVPKLHGVKLKPAKKRLRAAHCRVGKVTSKRSKRSLVGRVLATRPRARAVKPSGARVSLVVGRRR